MDRQMQRGPPDYPNDFFGLTNYTEVLHDHNLNVDLNIVSEAHSPKAEANEQTIIPYDVQLAISCLETGIGIEVWALQAAWPGICDDIWWYDFYHPDTIHPATIASINAMLARQDNDNRKFDCPVFVAESRHGWPRTCNNVKSTNMAELRRHLTTRAGRGYTPQLPFLELCPTCNEDFLDKREFESRHGYRGEFCNTRRPQRRWPQSRVQWELLYGKVEASIAVQRLSSQRVDLAPTPAQALTPQNLAPHHETEEPAVEPTDDRQTHPRPYVTPYELIFDSDSDEGRTATSPNHTSLSSASGSEQPIPNIPMSHIPRWESVWSAYEPRTQSATQSQYTTSNWTSSAQDCTPMEDLLNPSTPHDSDHFPVAEPLSFIDWRDHRDLSSQEDARHEVDIAGSSVSHQMSYTDTLSMPMQRSHSTRSSVYDDSSSGPPTFTPEVMYCDIGDCRQAFTGQYRRGNLGRHKRQKHREGQAYACEDDTCTREFQRKDARLKHYRRNHPELAVDSPLVRRSDPSHSTRRDQEVDLSNICSWAT